MARNRTIYASQSVWCNGELLYRVQSFGSTAIWKSILWLCLSNEYVDDSDRMAFKKAEATGG